MIDPMKSLNGVNVGGVNFNQNGANSFQKAVGNGSASESIFAKKKVPPAKSSEIGAEKPADDSKKNVEKPDGDAKDKKVTLPKIIDETVIDEIRKKLEEQKGQAPKGITEEDLRKWLEEMGYEVDKKEEPTDKPQLPIGEFPKSPQPGDIKPLKPIKLPNKVDIDWNPLPIKINPIVVPGDENPVAELPKDEPVAEKPVVENPKQEPVAKKPKLTDEEIKALLDLINKILNGEYPGLLGKNDSNILTPYLEKQFDIRDFWA